MLGKLTAKVARKRPAKKSFLLGFYFSIIFAIAGLAIILDLVVYRLIPTDQQNTQPYDSIFLLASKIASERLLSNQTNTTQWGELSLSFTEAGQVHFDTNALSSLGYQLLDLNGQTYLAWLSEDKRYFLQLGPIEKAKKSIDWVALVFYGALFILVSVWLRPLLRDLDRLAEAVNDFRVNYRSELPQLKHSSNLKPLADDIDALAQRTRQLIDTQKDLSRVLSHEMRTPLSRIKFSLALIESPGGLTDEQANELRGISNDVQELEELTHAMLDFAKLDHPDMALERHWLDADLWLKDYQQRCKRLRQETTLEFELTSHTQEAKIFADPTWLDLAINNLVSNALRYARTLVRIELTTSAHGFKITVKDDGPGIKAQEMAKVTRPFYQPEDEQRKSFGLGLALVKRIAQLHQGTLAINRADIGGASICLNGRNPIKNNSLE